jgi:neutral ceramidase
MLEIGASKVDITIFKENVGMLGYGIYYNVVKGIATPIYVRAFVLRRDGRKIAFVNAEICFSTVYLKTGVVQALQERYPQLGFTDANVMITAQHTHSAPGGFTQHFLYNLIQPGFQQDVYEKYRDGIVEAIVEADQKARPATMRLAKEAFAPDIDIAFNRSVGAYNQNPDIERPLGPKESHLGVDRTMKLLRFDGLDGRPIGSVNFFGVHTTSLSNDNTKICSDNKGYAAQYLEHAQNSSSNPEDHEVIGAFAQDVSGDVTPNYVWDRKKSWTRGPYEDDFESAKYSGRLQYDMASGLFDSAAQHPGMDGSIDYIQTYVDFSDLTCDPDFTEGRENCRTSPACLGIAFLRGTREGPGAPPILEYFVKTIFPFVKTWDLHVAKFWRDPEIQETLRRQYETQYPKAVVMEPGMGRVMAAPYVHRLIIPGFTDPVVKYMKHLGREGVTKQTPWITTVLPIQIFLVGPLALVGIPAEITTVAGQRLRAMLEKELAPRGITEVQLAPYANGYAGYITTQEEYQVQRYEGGHTLFGRWTLAAYQTEFRKLARQLVAAPQPEQRPSDWVNSRPYILPEEEIWRGFKDERIRVKV